MRYAFLSVFTLVGAMACRASHTADPSFTVGPLTVSGVYIVAPAGDAPSAMYFTVMNAAATPDTLTDVRVTDVAHADMHTQTMMSMSHDTGVMAHDMGHEMSHGMAHDMSSMTTVMTPTPEVAVPSGGALRFTPGGRHVMLTGARHRFMPGEVVAAEMTFRHGGTAHIRARVVTYAQLDSLREPREAGGVR